MRKGLTPPHSDAICHPRGGAHRGPRSVQRTRLPHGGEGGRQSARQTRPRPPIAACGPSQSVGNSNADFHTTKA